MKISNNNAQLTKMKNKRLLAQYSVKSIMLKAACFCLVEDVLMYAEKIECEMY